MQKTSYLNGELLTAEDAKISINDRGFLLGDGLFETIRYDNNHAIHFEQHWSRLQNGCKTLNIPLPLDSAEAQHQINQLLKQNQLDQSAASIRITLTRGSGPRGLAPPKPAQPLLMIQCFEIPKKKQMSISVTHSDIIINERSPSRHFKSLSYTDHIIARQYALDEGYDDALLYNSQGFLVSTSCANIFLVIDNVLITPPITSGALPGIMRQHIIDQAIRSGITVSEKNLRQSDCDAVQHAFISNSIIQLTPLHRLGDRALSLPGSVYNQLI